MRSSLGMPWRAKMLLMAGIAVAADAAKADNLRESGSVVNQKSVVLAVQMEEVGPNLFPRKT